MNEIEQRLDAGRRRVFINSLISTITDIVVLLLLFKTGVEQGWATALPIVIIMGLLMAFHGRTVLFQLGYVPQYLSDRLNHRTARDMIEEAVTQAGLSYAEVAADIMASETGYSYIGAKYMYFFYVDRVYIFPRDEIAWVYFTGWRLMTRLFHWEIFYLPHVGLKNGRVQTIMGYVFNREEYEKFAAGRAAPFPQAVFGYSAALADLYHGAREKFLALAYTPDDTVIAPAERERLLREIDRPEERAKGNASGRILRGIGVLLILMVLAFLAMRFLQNR